MRFGPVGLLRLLSVGVGLALVSSSVTGQSRQSLPPHSAFVKSTVESAADVIDREYFDPGVAARTSASLRKWLAEGRYANVATPETLASRLTGDLYSLSHDKHLFVEIAPSAGGPYAGLGASRESREETVRVSNAGVQRVEILPGNVGYLNITDFFRPDEANEAIADAMHMLRHTDALIVDLRDNRGGSIGTTARFLSYFFNDSGLDLFDVTSRSGNVRRYATQPGVADRDEKRPMYALTSAHTWSGGEAVAYILQERHRAEIVGETTVGAANPAEPYKINAVFYINVPIGRIRSGVRGANWEGVGVVPDVAAPASEALHVAYGRALRQLLSRTPDGSWHGELQRTLQKLEAQPGKP